MNDGSFTELSLPGIEPAHAGSGWKTCLACTVTAKRSGKSSKRFPASGRLLNGHIYALPTSAPLTPGTDGSASPLELATPSPRQGPRP